MDIRAPSGSELRFSAYVEGLVSVIGHADRAGPLLDYCVGLLMPKDLADGGHGPASFAMAGVNLVRSDRRSMR